MLFTKRKWYLLKCRIYQKSGNQNPGLLVGSEIWDTRPILWVRPRTLDLKGVTQDSRPETQLMGGTQDLRPDNLKVRSETQYLERL